MKFFFEVRIKVDEEALAAGLVIARLSGLGFDGFVEEEGMVLAYREKTGSIEELAKKLLEEGITQSEINIIEDKNWNEIWESDYQPVLVSRQVMVRAPFHDPVDGTRYDIIIEPRMAFGTAHHETTSQMLSIITRMNIQGKRVLDMGCGTAVLAILALKMGASNVLAIDFDEWAYQNALDNLRLNEAHAIEVLLGDADLLKNREFDIIFANINRNILLEDIPRYASVLARQGSLLMSGFYEEDLVLIEQKANASGLRLESTSVQNKWMAALFISH